MKFPDAMTTPPVPASPEKSRIPVMFSATGGWGLPLGVAIHTLCLHASSGRFYDIHIVHDGMDARIIQELNQVAAPFPQVSLSFLQLPEEFRHLFQNGNKDRYSPLAYARLMAGSLFPQYGRIVYLDADVLLAGDVAELYFSDLRGASVAAAGDGLALWSIEKGTMHPHLEYMGNYLSSPLSYCNSGVLVLDLDQMRRRNLEHRLLQQLRSRPEPFPYPDQDILNIALHGDMTPLPPEWNFQFLSWTWDEEKTRLLRGTEFENVPSISCGRSWKLLHMVGPEKPWRLPDTPGTMGQFHWILYSFFWWPEAKRLPAFREELDAISQGLAPLLQRHIRGQQWKLFFSRGHIFRKRRDKIRWLKNCCPFLTAENRNRLPPPLRETWAASADGRKTGVLRRLFPADLQTPVTSAFNAACAVPASAGVPVPCPWPGGAPPWSGTAANGRLSDPFSGRHVRKCRPAEYCRPGHCL